MAMLTEGVVLCPARALSWRVAHYTDEDIVEWLPDAKGNFPRPGQAAQEIFQEAKFYTLDNDSLRRNAMAANDRSRLSVLQNRELAEMWKELNKEGRAEYEVAAQKDAERHRAETEALTKKAASVQLLRWLGMVVGDEGVASACCSALLAHRNTQWGSLHQLLQASRTGRFAFLGKLDDAGVPEEHHRKILMELNNMLITPPPSATPPAGARKAQHDSSSAAVIAEAGAGAAEHDHLYTPEQAQAATRIQAMHRGKKARKRYLKKARSRSASHKDFIQREEFQARVKAIRMPHRCVETVKARHFVSVHSQLDLDNDGFVTADDLAGVMRKLGKRVSRAEAASMAWEVDDRLAPNPGRSPVPKLAAQDLVQMYFRVRADTKGFEPRRLFNVLEFLLFSNADIGGDERCQSKSNLKKQRDNAMGHSGLMLDAEEATMMLRTRYGDRDEVPATMSSYTGKMDVQDRSLTFRQFIQSPICLVALEWMAT